MVWLNISCVHWQIIPRYFIWEDRMRSWKNMNLCFQPTSHNEKLFSSRVPQCQRQTFVFNRDRKQGNRVLRQTKNSKEYIHNSQLLTNYDLFKENFKSKVMLDSWDTAAICINRLENITSFIKLWTIYYMTMYIIKESTLISRVFLKSNLRIISK